MNILACLSRPDRESVPAFLELNLNAAAQITAIRYPVVAGYDIGEVEFFSYLFKFFRINQQDCKSFRPDRESALISKSLT
jgi:hypothetical protein